MSRDNVQKMEDSLYMEIAPEIDLLRKHHATMTKNEAQIANNLPIQNPFSTFTKINHLFQPAAFYLVQPCLTTPVRCWKS